MNEDNKSRDFVSPVDIVQGEILKILSADPWFAAHKVELVGQNSQDMQFLLQKTLAQVKGVALIVGLDSSENMFPALVVEVTITAIECVPINRKRAGWVSAIDALFKAVYNLDSEYWHWDDMRHESPADNVLQATAHFRGSLKREGESLPKL